LFFKFINTPQYDKLLCCQLKPTGTSHPDLLSLSDVHLSELFPSRSASDSDLYEELASDFSYFKKQLHSPVSTREAFWKEYLYKHPES